MISFIITNDQSVTAVIKNKPVTIPSTHLNYSKIIQGLKDPNTSEDELDDLINVKLSLKQYIQSEDLLAINLQNGTFTYNNVAIDTTLTKRIVSMYKQGFDVQPMVKFLTNLYQNPSHRSISELYSFIEYGKLPITEDGCFLAYKKVNDDYTSCHDGKTKNDIGLTVSMPRQSVDDRSENTCSHGLHICSYDYLTHFSGARVIIVKVNPKDVVSIPTDYKHTKARVCEYLVVSEMDEKEKEADKPILPPLVDLSKRYSIMEDESEAVEVEEDTSDEDDLQNHYITAYNHGYRLGRSKASAKTYDNVAAAAYSNFALTYFQHGYRDGKAHRAKRFK
jgi:hypothetical protein